MKTISAIFKSDAAGLLGDQEPTSTNGTVSRRQDLLRRFTSTPHAVDLRLMRRTIRVESNNRALLDLAFQFFERHQHGETSEPEFTWRIVCEADPRVQDTDAVVAAFSDPGVRYVSFGQRGFIAVDIVRREAVGFLSETYLKDEPRLRHRPPLDILMSLTCSSLKLVTLSGGCVGSDDRGVLVFGPPNSGKTTACYLAARGGLKFHADQLVFLDARGASEKASSLQAWGDPFPAFFRQEAPTWLPELKPSARMSTYGNLSFYYLDKAPLQARRTNPIEPICTLFLDRTGTGEPRLTELATNETLMRLRDCVFIAEGPQFESQIENAIMRLAQKPAYNLIYERDPKIAASFLERLML